MSRCLTCNKKPYDCHCLPPAAAVTPAYWQRADGVFELINTACGDRLFRRPKMLQLTGLSPSGHLLEVPPQWNGEYEA